MEQEQRDSTGKFTKGNPGRPGRPRRQTEERFMAAFAEAVTDQEWRSIIEKAKAAALEGDGAARSWLAKYLIGSLARQPEPIVEPPIASFGELQAEIDRLSQELDPEPTTIREVDTRWLDEIEKRNPAFVEKYWELKRQQENQLHG